jgi:hypothetical protein
VDDCKEDFYWCSNKLRDVPKPNLFWRDINAFHGNSCVYIQLDDRKTKTKYDLSLGYDQCESEKSIICEASGIFNRSNSHKATANLFIGL